MAQARAIDAIEIDGTGREPRDARRRRELVEATIASIARYGLMRTTVARVANIAGCSTGIVNFYFEGKGALLLATLEHVNAEFERVQREALASAGDDPAKQLASLIDVAFDPSVSSPERLAVWTAFWGEAATRADYMKICGDREAREERTVVGLFEELARARSYAHLDAAALGRGFYQLITNLPDAMLDESMPFDFEGARATCRGFLRSLFPQDFPAPGSEGLGPSERVALPKPQPIFRGGAEMESELQTLPTWVYRDPEFFQLEVDRIFKAQWLPVGHISHVPAPGDYMTLDVVGERIFVIRDREGRLRAMPNVCRHRASRVVRGDTGHCSSSIKCPYHGWTYAFDGSLRDVPGEETFEDLDRSRRGLPPIELEEWMGFVFIRLGGAGPSVAESMHSFAEEAGHYRLLELKPWGGRSTTTHAFNWKVLAEKDAERYHTPVAHPGLRRLFGSNHAGSALDLKREVEGSRTCSALQEDVSSNWSEGHYQRLSPVAPHLPESLQRAWIRYGVYPTTVIQLSPELVECYAVLPVAPGRCKLFGFALAHEDDSREMRVARYLKSRITRQVVKEELEICHWTDEGIRSDSYSDGVLSTLESGVGRLQQRIRELIPVARCLERPPIGGVTAKNEEMCQDARRAFGGCLDV